MDFQKISNKLEEVRRLQLEIQMLREKIQMLICYLQLKKQAIAPTIIDNFEDSRHFILLLNKQYTCVQQVNMLKNKALQVIDDLMADEFVLKRNYEKIHILKNIRRHQNSPNTKPLLKDLNISWQIQSILDHEDQKEEKEGRHNANIEMQLDMITA